MQLRTPVLTALVAAGLNLVGCASRMPEGLPENDAALAVGMQPGDAITFQTELPDDAPPDPAGAGNLSHADVIRRSAQNSADIQSAMARVRIAQADAKQSRLFPNPVVNLALRFPENSGTIIDAGLSADLIAILQRPGSVDAADARLRVASAEAISVVLDDITAAQEQFFSIQALEASLAVFTERRALLDRLHTLAESKLRLGEGTRLDVVTLQIQRVELEAEVADAELQLRDERLSLARRIGQPSSAADWSLPKWEPRNHRAPDESSSIRLALERRPEVQQRLWELAAFGYEKKLAEWGLWNGTEAGVDAERDGDWSVGPSASLPIPLFDMGQAQRQKAMAMVIEARHHLTSARRRVIEDVRRDCATLAASRKNLDRINNELLPLQESRLQQAEAQFRAGQTDITGLLIAEHDLRSTRAQRIELQGKVEIARVRLERAVGGAGVLASITAQSTTMPTTQRKP